MAQGQNKLPHSSTRRGFSTHNSVGTDCLANPNIINLTTQQDGTTGYFQPGMIEMKTQAGVPWYLWVDDAGNLRINATIPTDATDATDQGTVVGTQT